MQQQAREGLKNAQKGLKDMERAGESGPHLKLYSGDVSENEGLPWQRAQSLISTKNPGEDSCVNGCDDPHIALTLIGCHTFQAWVLSRASQVSVASSITVGLLREHVGIHRWCFNHESRECGGRGH